LEENSTFVVLKKESSFFEVGGCKTENKTRRNHE